MHFALVRRAALLKPGLNRCMRFSFSVVPIAAVLFQQVRKVPCSPTRPNPLGAEHCGRADIKPDHKPRHSRLRVLVIGALHGNDLSSVSVALHMRLLLHPVLLLL